MELTRADIARRLGHRAFSLRRISFAGFGYGDAYRLAVKDLPSAGSMIPADTYAAHREVYDALTQLKGSRFKGCPIMT